MQRAAPTGLVMGLLLGSGCAESEPQPEVKSAGSVEPVSTELAEPEPPRSRPQWLVVPWGTRLHAAPDFGSLRLTLPSSAKEAGMGTGALFRVIAETDTGWWQLETVSHEGEPPTQQREQPLAGLDVFALTLYVPAGTGSDAQALPESKAEPIDADASVGLQSGEEGRDALQFEVHGGDLVFWPDGSDAGTVRRAHAFAEPGERKVAGAVPAICFPIVFGPASARGKTELCYEVAAVSEASPKPDPESLGTARARGGE